MSKVIAGLSEEDAISFTSQKSKITINFNGKIEYNDIIKNEKHGIFVYPLNKSLIFIILFEILCVILFRIFGSSRAAVLFGIFYVCVQYVRTINTFAYRKSTKRNHAAEHMVYNANYDGLDLTLENVRKSDKFCKYCGSCFIGNVLLLSLINIPLVIFTGLWIPFTLISWVCKNLNTGIPFNPFTHFIQKNLTDEPSDFNLFIALLTINVLKTVDEYEDKFGEVTPTVVLAILNREVSELVSNNDFDFDTSSLKVIFNKKNGGL